MKRSLSDLAFLGLFACTLLLTAIVVKREFFGPPKAVSPIRHIKFSADLSMVGQVLGRETAPVAIVVFADFQCPFCARAQPAIDSVLGRYPDSVKVLYRHLPLETIHPHAWTAALAAECAADQGRFGAYHDLLYRLQDSIGLVDWADFASRANVANLKEFRTCLKDERKTQAIERDVLTARRLDLRGTPAFIIGDELVEGLPPKGWIEARVGQALKKRS